MTKFIAATFDSQWDMARIEKAVGDCPKADVFPVIQRHLKPGMRILESGCGFGKWLLFYKRQGYEIVGLDWSPATGAKVKAYEEGTLYVGGDARRTPFQDGAFDLILSLGTIEHSVDGPGQALGEAYRTLKPGGTLISTVPILTPARRWIHRLKSPVRVLKSGLASLRSRIRREPFQGFTEVVKKGLPGLLLIAVRGEGGYHFFEYRFPLESLRECVAKAGFRVVESFPMSREEGALHDLSPFGGSWDFQKGEPRLSLLTRTALRLFPGAFWHMAVCVGVKPAEGEK
ncbi:MAG: class I SAM-dependent methyltransferase [Elusimicrobia bacterium]|nr:class I SAM-dependent methyltransferase [Elusimicrobiota bacterium]